MPFHLRGISDGELLLVLVALAILVVLCIVSIVRTFSKKPRSQPPQPTRSIEDTTITGQLPVVPRTPTESFNGVVRRMTVRDYLPDRTTLIIYTNLGEYYWGWSADRERRIRTLKTLGQPVPFRVNPNTNNIFDIEE